MNRLLVGCLRRGSGGCVFNWRLAVGRPPACARMWRWHKTAVRCAVQGARARRSFPMTRYRCSSGACV